MSRSRIDVVLATHEGARHLPAQLASIAGQSEPPDRLVVVDDASTDDTVEILAAFAERGDLGFAVDVTRNAVRRGSRVTFAAALARSDGDVVVLCDQDDVWHGDRIAVAATAIACAGGDVVLTTSDAGLMDECGARVVGTVRTRLVARRRGASPTSEPVIRALTHPARPGATLAFTAGLRDLALPLPEAILDGTASLEHDGWIVALAAAGGTMLDLAEELVTYRLHGGQQIGLASESAGLRTVRLGQIARADAAIGAHIAGRAASAGAVAARLRERRCGAPETLAALEEMVIHLEWRRTLPASGRVRELRRIGRELRSRRYTRFSSGCASALVDLARVLRGP